MPTMTLLVDGTIPVAEDLNGNWRRLNQAIGTGTSITTYTQGDLLYASATDTLSRLAIGNAGDVLSMAGGLPRWSASGGVSGTWQQRGLRGTVTTTSVTASADSVMLRNSDLGIKVFEATGNVTCDSAAAGLNGRDQAAVFAANQELFAYWISNGTLLRTVLANSAPPTGPDLTTLAAFSGYTYWAPIGPLLWNNSSNFLPLRIRGAQAYYETQPEILTNGQATTETAVDFSVAVPSAAPEYALHGSANNPSGVNAAGNPEVRVFSGLRHWGSRQGAGVTTNAILIMGQFSVPYTGTLFYQWAQAPGGAGGLYLHVVSYRMANGGE